MIKISNYFLNKGEDDKPEGKIKPCTVPILYTCNFFFFFSFGINYNVYGNWKRFVLFCFSFPLVWMKREQCICCTVGAHCCQPFNFRPA